MIVTSENRSAINCENDRSSSLVMNVWMVGILVTMSLSTVTKGWQ